jgi:hypothetical protein
MEGRPYGWARPVWAAGFLWLMAVASRGQAPAGNQNADRLRLVAAEQNTQPTLRIVLPGRDPADSTIEVIFPEHVTARKKGATEAEHLYMPTTDHGAAPAWRQAGQSLEYEKELPGGVRFLARATM